MKAADIVRSLLQPAEISQNHHQLLENPHKFYCEEGVEIINVWHQGSTFDAANTIDGVSPLLACNFNYLQSIETSRATTDLIEMDLADRMDLAEKAILVMIHMQHTMSDSDERALDCDFYVCPRGTAPAVAQRLIQQMRSTLLRDMIGTLANLEYGFASLEGMDTNISIPKEKKASSSAASDLIKTAKLLLKACAQ